MKVKELIKLLQQEDPECQVSIGMEAIGGIERLPGYYDGPFTYLENGKFHISKKGSKIRINLTELSDVAFEGSQEDFVFHFDGANAKQDEEEYRKEIEKWIEYGEKLDKQSSPGFISDVTKKIKEGWKIIQPLNSQIGHYNEMWYIKDVPKFKNFEENDNMKKLCQGECGAVLEYGLFKHVKQDNFYLWEFKSPKEFQLHKKLYTLKLEE